MITWQGLLLGAGGLVVLVIAGAIVFFAALEVSTQRDDRRRNRLTEWQVKHGGITPPDQLGLTVHYKEDGEPYYTPEDYAHRLFWAEVEDAQNDRAKREEIRRRQAEYVDAVQAEYARLAGEHFSRS